MIIYADLLFLSNFCMDYLILKLTAKMLHRGKHFLLSAFLGGIYGVIAVRFPPLGSAWVQLLFAAGMTALSFPPSSWINFVKAYAMVLFGAFASGGLLIAVLTARGQSATYHGMLYFDFSLAEFLLLAGLCWLFLSVISRLEQTFGRQPVQEVLICCRGKCVRLSALVDTGCSLVDPLTGYPVMVAEYEKISSIFSEELKGMLTDNCTGPVPERIYQIPFHTLEYGTGGMLTAFRPDSVTVIQNRKETVLTHVLVGVVQKKLTDDQSYEALLHPSMIGC